MFTTLSCFKSCCPRDLEIFDFAKRAVARIRALLAKGEKCNNWLIMLRVINVNMREPLSMILCDVGRASDQTSETANRYQRISTTSSTEMSHDLRSPVE
jgi:hypothetical protein